MSNKKLAEFRLDSDEERAVDNIKSSSKNKPNTAKRTTSKPFVSPIKIKLENSYDNLLDDLDETFEESEEPDRKSVV